jgi:arginase
MPRPITVIGAPTNAGALASGPEEAPAALRAAGLNYKLRQAGADTEDHGDFPGFRWAPDRDQPRAMNAEAVAWVALDVAERVAEANAEGRLGGDCAVGIGTYLGTRLGNDEPWLLYPDPHADLNAPQDNTSGALGGMGHAHLLGRPGAVSQLVELDDGPALEPERLILLGASPTRSREAEREAIDSDCIDFADLPICENTDRNVGLPPQTAFQALPYAAAGPGLQAIPITKIVPNHCAADGSAISTFTHGLVTALIKGWV